MAWNGAGVVTRTDGVRTGSDLFAQQQAAAVLVRADLMDAHANDLATAINAAMPRNGEAPATANWPMGGNRLTGLGAGVAGTDSATVAQAQSGGLRYAGAAAGTANALTVSMSPAITAYANGQDFWFLVSSTNTAADPTIAVNGLAALPLESAVGVGVTQRQLIAGRLAHGVVVGVGGTPSVVVVDGLVIDTPLPRGYLDGFQISNDTDAAHDILIGTGSARSSADAANIVLAAAITKQIDAAWAVGDDAGGLDTGTVAVDTWYALHAIKRPDTGVVDVLFSLSETAPTMPANYTLRRRIGWVQTDASANILPFTQRGNEWWWEDPPLDVDEANTQGATAILHTISAPPSTLAKANVSIHDSSGINLYLSPTFVDDEAVPSTTATAPLASHGVMNGGGPNCTQLEIAVDASSQIRARCDQNFLNQFSLATLGWVDRRGKQ